MPTLVEHQMPARVEATLLIEDLVKQQERETIQKSGLKTESNQKSDQKILEAISKNSVITIKELQELTGLSESGVKKIIRNLRADNQIRRVGPDKGGHWEIVGP